MICRLCLINLNVDTSVNIFNEVGNDGESKLVKIIAKYIHLEVTQQDEVSTAICQECHNHLTTFHKYCEFVEKQQSTLNNKFLVVEFDEQVITPNVVGAAELQESMDVQLKCEPEEELVAEAFAMRNDKDNASISSHSSEPSSMAPRRPRKTNRGIKDFDKLLDAIKAIKIYNKSRKSTARTYNINMSSLCRYVLKFDAAVPDIMAVTDDELLKVLRQIASYATPCLVFNEEQEEALFDYVMKCAEQYYGLSIIELKELAYQFAKKIHVEYPRGWDANKMAGQQWYLGFMQRHQKLFLRSHEQTNLNRVKAFCRENVDHFFRNLDSVFAVHPFTAGSIWNMDEIGFSTVPTQMCKIISVKGLKRVNQITSSERGSMITLAFAVSASGNSMPPFYLFPRKTMKPLYLAHASNETIGFANNSGRMQQAEFVKFMEHFIKYSDSSSSSPKLLLLDNHSSHLSMEAIDMAAKNGVKMLSFPPHCSHRLQPLDISVFGPVKGAYHLAHNTWMSNNAGKTIDMALIPMHVATALLRGATSENIVDGFRKTGICPYNPSIFNDSHFVSLDVDKANEELSAIEIEYDTNEQRRIVFDASEPSTSHISVAGSLASVKSSIGPMREATPQKKWSSGVKAQKTTMTTPANFVVHTKRSAANGNKEANVVKKQRKALTQSFTPESIKNEFQQKE